MSTEAQITHATRKLNNAVKTKEEVNKTESDLKQRLGTLQTELQQVKKLADEASGEALSSPYTPVVLTRELLVRGTA